MDEVNHALQRIARGTGIVFVGTILSTLIGFLSRTVIARSFSADEYGVFNLVLTVLNIALLIVPIGFQSSLPREIAFYSKKKPSIIGNLIFIALIIIILNSTILTTILIIEAEEISHVFAEPRLKYALKLVSFALPFSALIVTIVSISRGVGRVREQVYFQNIVHPALFLVFVVIVVILNLPFAYVFVAYLSSQVLTFLGLTLNALRVGILKFRISFNFEIGKNLVVFTLSLMFTGILGFIMRWTDTLMIGYYKGSEAVGLYTAASPLAALLPIFLNSAAFLYMPLASQLYAQKKLKEMGRVYRILTKWTFLLTLPIFVVLFLFPKASIAFFFGDRYVSAAVTLQVLVLGFMFHTCLGLNGLSLTVTGDTKSNFIANLFAALFNIVLNLFLIPAYGIVGSAIATTTSYFIANILRSLRLYQRARIHPFSWNYVKSLVISFVLLGIIRSLNLEVLNMLHVVPILAVFLVVYFFSFLIIGCIDKEEIELLITIERKLRIDSGMIKKILKRFV